MSEFVELLTTAVEHTPATAAVVGGGLGLRRVVGPSLDAIGGALGKFTQYRAENLLKIGEKAQRRLSDGDDPDVSDSVHPRVARAILDEGSWINDDLHQEYLAGLLVSARSKDGRSDRDAYLARMVAGLSAEQIRLHYLTINAYAGYWDGQGDLLFPMARRDHYRRHAILISVDELAGRFDDFESAARGLVREGVFQEFGRPLTDSGIHATHTSIIVHPLAFDIWKHAIAGGTMNESALFLSRATLAAYVAQNPRMKVTYPEPEPDRLLSASVHDLGP